MSIGSPCSSRVSPGPLPTRSGLLGCVRQVPWLFVPLPRVVPPPMVRGCSTIGVGGRLGCSTAPCVTRVPGVASLTPGISAVSRPAFGGVYAWPSS